MCTVFANGTAGLPTPLTAFSVHTPNAVESIASVQYATTMKEDVRCENVYMDFWHNNNVVLSNTTHHMNCGNDMMNSFTLGMHPDFLICARVTTSSGNMFTLSRQAFPWPRTISN
jgi:hypothetical protein